MYDILEISNDFIAINKWPNVDFHGEGLVDSVRSEVDGEVYPVHRLDKVTSGILLFARTKEVAREISEQFEKSTIEKIYIALSDSKPKKKQGTVKGDLEKSRRGAWKITRTFNNPSVTRFQSHSLESGLRLFVLKPKTGKTHQLRVVMKSLGSPILGDSLYSGKESDRTYLHAYKISFKALGKEYSLEAPFLYGEEFTQESFSSLVQSLF